MGSRIASWSLSGVQNDTWRVYSSLLLPEGQPITTIDCKSGELHAQVCGGAILTHSRIIGGWNAFQLVRLYSHTRERSTNMVIEMVTSVCDKFAVASNTY